MFSCSAPQWLPIYVKLKAKLQAALLWSAVDRVVGYPGIRCWLLLAGVSAVQSGSHDQCLLSWFLHLLRLTRFLHGNDMAMLPPFPGCQEKVGAIGMRW